MFKQFGTAGLWIATVLCALQCAPMSADTAVPAAEIDLRLIALNDFHGYIVPPDEGLAVPDPRDASKTLTLPAGGAASLATLVQRLQAGHPLNAVVAAGDLVGASPFASALFHDEPTIQALNAIGLSLSAVGNHEFDHGRDELLRLQNGGCHPRGERGRDTCIGGDFVGAQFHYLAANVVDRVSRRPLFAPYEIKTFTSPGVRALHIAFIGLVLQHTASMVLPSGITSLEFRDEAATANALVPQLQKLGVDAIVLLIHQGGSTSGSFNDHRCPDFSGELLAILDALDSAIRVVVSGHTHQAYICRRGDRLVTSAGSYGRLLTAIDLHFDAASGALRAFEADNYPVVNAAIADIDSETYAPLPPDAAVAALLKPYQDLSTPLGERVIGHLTAPLLRKLSAAGESTLGDVIADSMLDAAQKAGAAIAFTNSGGLRQDLIPRGADGAISYAQLFAALPFDNALVAMDLSGAQIKTLLRQQRRFPQPRPLQVSRGFGYSWSAGRLDGPSVKLLGEPVLASKTYRVVVNQFLAEGGDGFEVLTRGTHRVVVGRDLDAALSYFDAHSPLTPSLPARIVCDDCVIPDTRH
ncbi:MAG: bifunctional metallophosphatase/5-nucleotidase [Nevskia sp.]|nr:bifunctional metallophosphatase/5-nucleotidase [Nevskia sp.]